MSRSPGRVAFAHPHRVFLSTPQLWDFKIVLNPLNQKYEKDASIRVKLLDKFTASFTFELDVSWENGIDHVKVR